MATSELIDVTADLDGFFRQVVNGAVREGHLDASDATRMYLVALLADYAKPGALKRETLRRPFTFLLRDALRAQGAERFERLRSLGDDVLYVTGFFGDHLDRRGVERQYVTGVGSRAYDEAAAILKRMGPDDATGPDVFAELAARFDGFVDVVRDVSDAIYAMNARAPADVVDLYERWMKRGSTSLAEALVSWGIVPRPSDGTLH